MINSASSANWATSTVLAKLAISGRSAMSYILSFSTVSAVSITWAISALSNKIDNIGESGNLSFFCYSENFVKVGDTSNLGTIGKIGNLCIFGKVGIVGNVGSFGYTAYLALSAPFEVLV